MAWFDNEPIVSYKKEYTHNLGHKPIVLAYVDLATLGIGTGWKQIPLKYSVFENYVFYVGTVDYYHKNDNTVVFTAPLNAQIVANIFIDPQYNAWYE